MAQKVTKNNTEATTSKLVDELLSQVDPSEILSKDGLFSKLKKQLIERVLQSELEYELGYDKHSKKGKKNSNRRNGSFNKMLKAVILIFPEKALSPISLAYEP